MVQLFLHDWNGEVLGEIVGAKNRKLTLGLNQSSSLVFDLPLKDHPLTDQLIEAADASMTSFLDSDFRLVSVYRTNPYTNTKQLLFVGPIIMARDGANQGDEATASFTCAGPFWRLTTRIADFFGQGLEERGITSYGPRAGIAGSLIHSSNEDYGNTWLTPDWDNIELTDEISIQQWGGFKNLAQAIYELSGEGSMNGFDWVVEPKLEEHSGRLCLGHWQAAPLIGEDKTDSVIFEYGVGQNNLLSAYRSRSLENFANTVYHVSSGIDPYYIEETNPASIANAGYFSAIADGDLIDTELRRSWVQLNKALRSKPKKLFEITPQRSDLLSTAGVIPIPMIDYGLGDRVRARVFYAGKLRWDIGIRIYSIDINWGDTGEETADLGLYLE